MIESLVLDAALKIADKFADLLKFRREKRREFFTTMLEPIFSDLSIVHANYLVMFQECSAKLRDHSIPIQEIIRNLAQQRVQYEGLRIKIASFDRELQASKLPGPYRQFLDCLIFNVPDGLLTTKYAGSFANGIVRALQEATASEFSRILSGEHGDIVQSERENLLGSVEATADFLKERWAQTCEKFAAAQVFSLT
jgi:hypothetical protein